MQSASQADVEQPRHGAAEAPCGGLCTDRLFFFDDSCCRMFPISITSNVCGLGVTPRSGIISGVTLRSLSPVSSFVLAKRHCECGSRYWHWRGHQCARTCMRRSLGRRRLMLRVLSPALHFAGVCTRSRRSVCNLPARAYTETLHPSSISMISLKTPGRAPATHNPCVGQPGPLDSLLSRNR
mgnify:CR=1 FL=1